jgi:peptide/nickel transport system ATP-binding protein
LMSAVPRPDPKAKKERIILQGVVASPAHPPSGCYFHPRCRYAQPRCSQEEPILTEMKPEHFVACHFAGQIDLRGVASGRIE